MLKKVRNIEPQTTKLAFVSSGAHNKFFCDYNKTRKVFSLCKQFIFCTF